MLYSMTFARTGNPTAGLSYWPTDSPKTDDAPDFTLAGPVAKCDPGRLASTRSSA
jgi:hypothetical protein